MINKQHDFCMDFVNEHSFKKYFRKFLYIEKIILIFLTIFYIYIFIKVVSTFFFFNDSLINALKAFRPFLKIYT